MKSSECLLLFAQRTISSGWSLSALPAPCEAQWAGALCCQQMVTVVTVLTVPARVLRQTCPCWEHIQDTLKPIIELVWWNTSNYLFSWKFKCFKWQQWIKNLHWRENEGHIRFWECLFGKVGTAALRFTDADGNVWKRKYNKAGWKCLKGKFIGFCPS